MDSFKICFSPFWVTKPKCIETDPRFVLFVANLPHFVTALKCNISDLELGLTLHPSLVDKTAEVEGTVVGGQVLGESLGTDHGTTFSPQIIWSYLHYL